MAVAMESKEDFLERIKSLVLEKGLKVSDLQVNLKEEDVDHFMRFIGKDWYAFGTCMGVEPNIMDHIKETGRNKPGRKRQLLKYLIELNKARYEDIIYGLYNSTNKHDPSINDILDYLLKHREFEDPKPYSSQRTTQSSRRSRATTRSSRPSSYKTLPWQARFEERAKRPPQLSELGPLSLLSPESYQNHFYNMLWLEEKEHMKKLGEKCNGKYKLFLYDSHKVPSYLESDHRSRYGYIKGPSFTDDMIEYATQASDAVTIAGRDGSDICRALKHGYNFNHLETQMYLSFHNTSNLSNIKRRCDKVDGGGYEIQAKFEVKHSYFDHLQNAVLKVPDYIRSCLIPDQMSFGSLLSTFHPAYSQFEFMKLDEEKQSAALNMITSDAFRPIPLACPPPPVVLYGPFGTGKTRILARAAYEVMMNGIKNEKCTRILICAHHPQSIETFIFAYFGRIERTQPRFPFKVIEISRYEKIGKDAHMYMTLDEFHRQRSEICKMDHVLIVVTYTMSLNLHQYFNTPQQREGFFTHLFLDEAAQVREPEAVTPLALATRNAKIVLAGDDKQVGPNILVLGEEARKYELHISLLERMMDRYQQLGPVAQSYVTKLSVNYRSHESLEVLPKFFYENLQLNYDKHPWEHKGPTGYSFVCSDSKLVPSYITPDHPFVEACIVLEEVLSYLKKCPNIHLRRVCVISSTRRQLNQIKDMAHLYKEYETVRHVSFQPSFTIQGHEFEAIFVSLFEPLENDESDAFFIKSLFNPYVFNTVLTRARTRVVAIGKPQEVLQFENATLSHPGRGEMKLQCWHEYLQLCRKNGTLYHEELLDQSDMQTKTPEPKHNDQASGHEDKHPWPNLDLSPQALKKQSPQRNLFNVDTGSVEGIQPLSPNDTDKQEQIDIIESEEGESEEDAGIECQMPSREEIDESLTELQVSKRKRTDKKLKKGKNGSKDVKGKKLSVGTGEGTVTEEDREIVGKFAQLREEATAQHAVIVQLSKDLENEMKRRLYLKKENEELKKKLKQALHTTIIDPSSGTTVAELKVPITSTAAQYVNWEDNGLRIHIPQGIFPLLESMTESISIAALVGGNFVFPANTRLVSAVYAVSVSKPLVKPVRLELQHCVHLTKQDELKYLKFAVAPHSGPPYNFHFIKGGKFATGSWSGSIDRQHFSLLCIVLEEDEEEDSSTDEENGQTNEENGQSNEEGSGHEEEGTNICQGEEESDNDKNSDEKRSIVAQVSHSQVSAKPKSVSMVDKLSYYGQIFYEEQIMTFVAVKKLNVLVKYVKDNQSHVKADQRISFYFIDDYIKLILDAKQKEPFTGWEIKPHVNPCKLNRNEIDNFGSIKEPAYCLVSVYPKDPSDSTTLTTLHYCVPLEGITDTKEIFILRSLKNFCRSSAEINSTIASTLKQTTEPEQPLDPEVVERIIRKHLADLSKLLSLSSNRIVLALELYSGELISDASYDAATDDSSKSDLEKGVSLANAIRATIKSQPHLLPKLIDTLKKVETFKGLAENMEKKIKTRES